MPGRGRGRGGRGGRGGSRGGASNSGTLNARFGRLQNNGTTTSFRKPRGGQRGGGPVRTGSGIAKSSRGRGGNQGFRNNNNNKRGSGGRRGGNRSNRGGKGKKLTQEALDKQLDAYMNRNEKVVSAKLDADLDEYMQEGQRNNGEEKKN